MRNDYVPYTQSGATGAKDTTVVMEHAQRRSDPRVIDAINQRLLGELTARVGGVVGPEHLVWALKYLMLSNWPRQRKRGMNRNTCPTSLEWWPTSTGLSSLLGKLTNHRSNKCERCNERRK
jgi:hypothetical protein